MTFTKRPLSISTAVSLAALMFLATFATGDSVEARNAVYIEANQGVIDSNRIQAEVPVVLDMYFENDLHVAVVNGLRLYSPTGATWTPVVSEIPYYDTLNQYYWDGLTYIYPYSVTGSGADTIGFAGWQIVAPGLEPGFSLPIMRLTFTVSQSEVGDTICVDSSFYRPAATWGWSGSEGTIHPEWDGPYCFEVASCCQDIRGDIDLNGSVNISDLSQLVGILFRQLPNPSCIAAADVDGNGPWNIVDVTTLVSYLFRGGPPPAPCP